MLKQNSIQVFQYKDKNDNEDMVVVSYGAVRSSEDIEQTISVKELHINKKDAKEIGKALIEISEIPE